MINPLDRLRIEITLLTSVFGPLKCLILSFLPWLSAFSIVGVHMSSSEIFWYRNRTRENHAIKSGVISYILVKINIKMLRLIKRSHAH